jgi:hypothetical protein
MLTYKFKSRQFKFEDTKVFPKKYLFKDNPNNHPIINKTITGVNSSRARNSQGIVKSTTEARAKKTD